MSRIWQTGAEWQVINELNDVSGNAFITTSTTRKTGGGAASYRLYQSDSSWIQNSGYVPMPTTATNVYYKADIYVDQLTATTNTASAYTYVYPIRFYGSNYIASVGLYNSAGTLHLFVQYGTSSTLSQDITLTGIGLDQWIRIEAHFDSTPADGSEIFEVKVNGTTVVSDTNLTLSGKTVSYMFYHVTNTNSGTRTAEMYMDNIAVNDAGGSINNSWVGEEYIIVLTPDGAGDSNPTNGTYASINEIPATKSQAGAPYSQYIYIADSSTNAQFTISDPLTYMDSNDKINAINVLNWSIYASSNPDYRSAIKSASGATAQESASGKLNSSDFYINTNNVTNYARNLISETDPTTGSRWKVTGTNSLSNAQIGVRPSSSGSMSTSALGAMVAFTPYTSPITSGMMIMFW